MDQKQTTRTTSIPARIGMYASAFGIFVCGWLTMKTEDWRLWIALGVLAIMSGVAASAFGKRAG